jgi:hypothetical protein
MKKLSKLAILAIAATCLTTAIPRLASADVGSVSVSAVQSAVRDARDSVVRQRTAPQVHARTAAIQ